MEEITNWLNPDLINNITYTVIQSIWQGALIALLVSILLHLLGRDNPIAKFKIAMLGISALFVSTIYTFISCYSDTISSETNGLVATISEWSTSIVLHDDGTFSINNNWIAYMWFIGVLLFTCKFLIDLSVVQYIRFTAYTNKECTTYQPILNTLLKENNQHLPIKVSNIIKTPVTIGFIKPLILFPIGMMTQLTIEEIESILIHEVAHITRKDYLINILQSIMGIILFYHPLVWWLSKIAKEEREYCCDDIAVKSQKAPINYAKTLVRIHELGIQTNKTLAVSFSDQSLLNRIQRIMSIQKSNQHMREKIIALSAIVVLLAFFSKDMLANVGNSIKEVVILENKKAPRENTQLDLQLMPIDTLPTISQRSYSMTKSDDNGSISIQKENGQITKLEIDGKEIPSTQYNLYEDEIAEMEEGNHATENMWMFGNGSSIDIENMSDRLQELGIEMESMDDLLGEDLQNWGENFGNSMDDFKNLFGDNFNSDSAFTFMVPEIDEEMMNQLQDLMGSFDIENLQDLEFDGNMNGLEDLFRGFDNEEYEVESPRLKRNRFGAGRTVEDKIGYELRKDRLIATGEISEIELSGKHMKINGDKQPKNIWNKYKNIFEEESGIVLSKDSKLKFNVEGKKTIKKSTAF